MVKIFLIKQGFGDFMEVVGVYTDKLVAEKVCKEHNKIMPLREDGQINRYYELRVCTKYITEINKLSDKTIIEPERVFYG